MTTSEKRGSRELQRLETRRRILQASLAEFKRSGVAAADVGAIVSAAGVARGTFYFHFPTREHVVDEVQRELVAQMSIDLRAFLDQGNDVWALLAEIVRLVVAGERRLGSRLFREVLGLYFSVSHSSAWEGWAQHSLVALLGAEIEKAREAGDVHRDVDSSRSALFFLLGVYSLLVSYHGPKSTRADVLNEFIASTSRGLAAR
ncbi:TetR/AcrR family transcriptional regulator [Mycobacterium syngnathidarum]